MWKKLASLAIGAAMLSASGFARAETTAPTLEPFGAPAPIAQTETTKLVTLTDNQMDKVTAGHYIGYWHNGWFYLRSYYSHRYWYVYGWHLVLYH